MKSLWLSCIIIVTTFALTASADVKLKVTKDSRRAIYLGTFGFTEQGAVTMLINSFSLAGNYLDDDGIVSPTEDSIGFVIHKVYSATTARVEKIYASKEGTDERLCFIDDPLLRAAEESARVIFPLNGKKIADIRNGLPITLPVTVRGLYGIFFYNCRGFKDSRQGTKLPVSLVSFDVRFKLFNTDPVSGKVSYLSHGTGPLPYWNMLFFAAFSIMTAVWVRELAANKAHVKLIHKIMLFLVVVKALSLLLESGRQMHFDSTGTTNFIDYFFYIIVSVKGMTLFGILLLLGTGFSVMKSFLGDNDRKLLLLVLPLQLIVNVLIAIIESTSEGNRSWQLCKDVLQILDLVCCCAVLLPLMWSMKNLNDVSAGSDKASAAIQQMSTFRNFYVVVLVYIYCTRVVIVLLEDMFPFDYFYVADVLREVIAVSFYSYTGYRFRPYTQGVYSAVPTAAVDSADIEMGTRKEMGHS